MLWELKYACWVSKKSNDVLFLMLHFRGRRVVSARGGCKNFSGALTHAYNKYKMLIIITLRICLYQVIEGWGLPPVVVQVAVNWSPALVWSAASVTTGLDGKPETRYQTKLIFDKLDYHEISKHSIWTWTKNGYYLHGFYKIFEPLCKVRWFADGK